jgi:hypothetical protein
MTRRLTIVALAALLAAACGSLTTEHVITGAQYAPHGGGVDIVMENEPPPPAFEEIALVRAFGNGNRGDLQSVIDGLREEARLVGANAVIRVRIDQGSSGMAGLGVAVRVP